MYTLPQQPQTIWEILKTSCIAIKVTFFKILPIPLFFLLLMIVAMGAAFYLKDNKITSQLVGLIFNLLQLAAYACLYYRIILLITENTNLDWESHIKIGVKRILPLLGLSILWMLFSLPGILLIVLKKYYFPSTISFPIIEILGFVYLMYIFIKFIFSVPLVSIPGHGVWSAMTESAKLVSGNFFRTAFLMIGVLIFLMAVLVAMIGLIFALNAPGEAEILKFMLFIALPIIAICSPLIMQIYAVFTVVVMNDLRIRKGSTGAGTKTTTVTV